MTDIPPRLDLGFDYSLTDFFRASIPLSGPRIMTVFGEPVSYLDQKQMQLDHLKQRAREVATPILCEYCDRHVDGEVCKNCGARR